MKNKGSIKNVKQNNVFLANVNRTNKRYEDNTIDLDQRAKEICGYLSTEYNIDKENADKLAIIYGVEKEWNNFKRFLT